MLDLPDILTCLDGKSEDFDPDLYGWVYDVSKVCSDLYNKMLSQNWGFMSRSTAKKIIRCNGITTRWNKDHNRNRIEKSETFKKISKIF